MKRFFVLILAIVMIIALTACGDNGKDGDSTTAETDISTTEAATTSSAGGGFLNREQTTTTAKSDDEDKTGTQTETTKAEETTAQTKLPQTTNKLETGVYDGTLVFKESPLVEFALQILDDPEILEQMTSDTDEEWAEECEDVDLSELEVREQFEESIATAESVINQDIPLKITITETNNTFTAAILIDFEDAFPDQGCETSEEVFEVEHSPGKVKFTSTDVEENVTTTFTFEGVILNNGDMEGTFAITVDSDEYEEFSGTSAIFSGNWSVKR